MDVQTWFHPFTSDNIILSGKTISAELCRNNFRHLFLLEYTYGEQNPETKYIHKLSYKYNHFFARP